MRDLRALLFDMDGVLVDSRDAIARSINHALSTHGLEPRPEEALHRVIGAPLPGVFAAYLREAGRDPADASTCLATYRERYVANALAETSLIDGMADVLETLATRWPLAVATTRPAEYALPVLEALGVADCFRVVRGSPIDAPRGEEKASTVGRALQALGVEAESSTAGPPAAMIGDRHYDVHGGRAHGLFTVGVTWGMGDEAELRDAGVQALVRRPAELLALFG